MPEETAESIVESKAQRLNQLRRLISSSANGTMVAPDVALPDSVSSDNVKTDGFQAAMNKLSRLLANRDRSVAEVRQRLTAEGFDTKTIEQVICRACGCEMLDDQRFTHAFICGKKSLGWGSRRIEAGLMKHEIDLRSLPGYPEDFFNHDEELGRALSCIAKSRSRAKNQYQARFKQLLSKGYSAEIAQKAISQLTLSEPRNTI
ncbi:MAG: hypothetical protein GX562_07515 [Coriobacteriaceae bacterium]|nr:hypothetical protein [Coriobacteriaceae bacterium]